MDQDSESRNLQDQALAVTHGEEGPAGGGRHLSRHQEEGQEEESPGGHPSPRGKEEKENQDGQGRSCEESRRRSPGSEERGPGEAPVHQLQEGEDPSVEKGQERAGRPWKDQGQAAEKDLHSQDGSEQGGEEDAPGGEGAEGIEGDGGRPQGGGRGEAQSQGGPPAQA